MTELNTKPSFETHHESLLESDESPRLTRGSRSKSILRLVADDSSDAIEREDHFQKLCLKQQIRSRVLRSFVPPTLSRDLGAAPEADKNTPRTSEASCRRESMDETLISELEEEVDDEMDATKSTKIQEMHKLMQAAFPKVAHGENLALEVRLKNISYSVERKEAESKIATVYNSSFLYPAYNRVRRAFRREGRLEQRISRFKILDDISLCLEPGKNYLVLGPPASGKTSLLKAIAGQLCPKSKKELLTGEILYNGRQLKAGQGLGKSKEWYIENAIAYIDQLDKHAPRLTVEETFDFSFQCKTGGSLKYTQHQNVLSSESTIKSLEKCDSEGLGVRLVLAALDLSNVKDTYVGNDNVRGVSGGQRRRVTVGEMVTSRQPVLCGDEISTGLDAASTYDMVEVLTHFGKISNMTRVFALLQPSPDTVSLFDEIILMAQGSVLYAGPIEQVEQYFADLGYKCPPFIDMADFLQTVSTEDGKVLYQHEGNASSAPTIPELASIFKASQLGHSIASTLNKAPLYVWARTEESTSSSISGLTMSQQVQRKYANSFLRNCALNLKRFLTIWTRDRRVIIASAVKNVLMGVSVGGVFGNVEDEISILGALFQAGLFIMLGAMQTASALVADRVIFYKHMDANFFSSWPFIIGRTASGVPQTVVDVLMFGSILYFMVGLSDRDVVHFFIFISILIVFAITMHMQLAVFASFASEASLQVYSACTLLLFILFGGFIVAPAAIPQFYLFIYWWNPFAWAYRALVINEFRSDRYSNPDDVLRSVGFTYGANAAPFELRWLGFCFVYMVLYLLLCLILTAIGLSRVRQTGEPTPPDADMLQSEGRPPSRTSDRVSVEFKAVTLSIQDIRYEVKASTKNETLVLLKDVCGIFRSGRMCALMGSSGAGKTTLMDVIALRKRTGSVSGDVRLNGWPQEKVSFRRCSGYVFQFDVQSPELTVRETVMFSARLRLVWKEMENEEKLDLFVNQVLGEMELTDLADSLVGTDEGIGLSFEQKKRLSIAVELAAAPSLIFLDEPTSGLDARSALVVMKALRNVTDQGRTVIATIHQPSSTIFNMFHDLLLLKRGGQVVYHGELGSDSQTMVRYFEELGAKKIELGENPANWMLRVITNDKLGDLAQKYAVSDHHTSLRTEIEASKASQDPDQKVVFGDEFAASRTWRRMLVLSRLRLIYWRSPAYNLSRLMVSLLIAFVLGSVFILKRNQSSYEEVEIRSRLSVVFLSFIITGIMAILSVIPVMTKIRDIFHRHRDAGMYDSASIGLALGGVEKPFIIVSGTIFTVVFLGVSGMNESLNSMIGFWGFFLFNFALYSYIGQAFVCVVQNQTTALILSSVFIGLNNFFSGLIVLPQLMNSGVFAVPYYITPGHYVFEGIVTSLFWDDDKTVTADSGSDFNLQLVQLGVCAVDDESCSGSVKQFVEFFFDNNFVPDNRLRNALVLGFVLVLTRLFTFLALKYVRFG